MSVTSIACCSPLQAPVLSDDEADTTAGAFKALADPQRVKIVNLLANSRSPVCVCDITAFLGLSQATTSFHLKKLTGAELVDREQRGTWAYYSLNRNGLRRLAAVATKKEV